MPLPIRAEIVVGGKKHNQKEMKFDSGLVCARVLFGKRLIYAKECGACDVNVRLQSLAFVDRSKKIEA